MSDILIHGTSSHGGRRKLTQVLTIFGVVLAIWLLMGLLRADLVARDYFAQIHEGQTVTNVETHLSPTIPPFWSVSIDGDVIQPGQTSPIYRSHMNVWVEPISGWVIMAGAG
jgi:hypothetical protein